MRTFDVEQRSPEWFALRAGVPTASRFSDIVTPKGSPSRSRDRYLRELMSELVDGQPPADIATPWMERGTALEDEAVRYYEFDRGVETTEVGFGLHDELAVGCSPDRLIGDDGGLEIKCPATTTHIGYLLGHEANPYKAQVQGALWITGRDWWDLYSYHPEMPPAIVRYERDEAFIDSLDTALRGFCARIEAAKDRLRAAGVRLVSEPTESTF